MSDQPLKRYIVQQTYRGKVRTYQPPFGTDAVSFERESDAVAYAAFQTKMLHVKGLFVFDSHISIVACDGKEHEIPEHPFMEIKYPR